MTPTVRTESPERGHALLGVIILTAVLLVTGLVSLQLTRSELHRTAEHAAHREAFYAAEAGVQHGLTQLHHDRTAANGSTGYTHAASGTVDGRAYSFTIDQDPNAPGDPRRKRIRSTGTVAGASASVLAHAFVQPSAPGVCDTLLSSEAGNARLFGVAGSSVGRASDPVVTRRLFEGEVFTNPGRDVEFTIHANLIAEADGIVRAGRDFVSNAALSLLSELDAQLLYGGTYRQGPLELVHAHAVPALPAVQGIHFNGVNDGSFGHGQVQPPVARQFPRPDYRGLARSARTVVVNADRVADGTVPGTWNAGTWELGGSLIVPSYALDPEVVYYVDGNVRIDTLLLAAAARATIVARGWMAVENLGLLVSGPLCTTASVLAGPASAGAPVCAQVGPATEQRLHLLAEKDLVIGYETIEVATSAAIEDLVVRGTVAAGTGIGTSVVNAGGKTGIFGYSETGEAWAMVSTLSAGADTRLNLCAAKDATLAFAASVADEVTTYVPGA